VTAVVSDSAALTGGLTARVGRSEVVSRPEVAGARRWLQLALGTVWLMDGVLQLQGFMFSRGFSQMLAGTAAGNPAAVADPINWAARLIAAHPVATNAPFAIIQILIGLGIANRRSVKVALAGSIVWSLGVWWLGEGLGGVLSGGASPVNGAPGAVILYALLAVLLWPAGEPAPEERPPPFVAARPVGVTAARTVWVVLWGSLAYFAVTAVNRTAQGLHDMVAGMAAGEPGWLAAINRGAAGLLDHRGLAASVVLAVLLAVIAAGVFLPARLSRVAIGLAIVLSLLIWVAGQDLGTILAGGGTDPNSGPLLVIIAFAYWPTRRLAAPAPANPGEPA